MVTHILEYIKLCVETPIGICVDKIIIKTGMLIQITLHISFVDRNMIYLVNSYSVFLTFVLWMDYPSVGLTEMYLLLPERGSKPKCSYCQLS